MDRVLVVTNAQAGSAQQDAVDTAVEVLGATHQVEVAATGDVGELRDVLATRDGRLVVVVGGDGSLHAAAQVLHDEDWLHDTELALVPLGTGNDFARTLGIPLDPGNAARALLRAGERHLDLLVEEHGVVVVNAVHLGVGVDAAFAAKDYKKTFGKAGYAIGALRAGFVSKGQKLRVVVDDQVVAKGKHHVLQVAVANGTYVGGGTPLAPEADPGDGLADVVLSYAIAPAKRVGYAALVAVGRHRGRRDVETYRGRSVTVTGPAFRWNVDGELDGPDARRSWTLRPGVLRMRVPVTSDAGAPRASA